LTDQKFLPFALPDLGEEEISEVVDSLRSGWLTTGPKTKRFEEEFAEFIGEGVQAIAVNSATAGLHLALEALGIGPGDEVITTPYTFTATAEVIRYLGAEVVFVDVDPQTLNIDASQLGNAITERTKAIIPVHFAGLACDMEEIRRIASAHKLRIIEDAAHSLPTRYKGKLIGSLNTDAAVFSFYATKTLATGEGGMIVTRNNELAQRCRVMRLHGISRDAFDRYTSEKPSWYYEVIAPGFKYNLTDIAASIGIHQLRKLKLMQMKREAIAQRYDEAFQNLPLFLPAHALHGDQHAWQLYVIRLRDDARIGRDEFIDEMYRRGIGCSVHFIPLHLHPYWRDTYHLQPEDFPVAYDAYKRAISLPIYSRMSEQDQERVVNTVIDLLER
jgi:dTDP-4-amino-4,6-dideoxygalactose transaminase